MSEALKALFRSRKFLILMMDAVIALVLYFVTKYAGQSVTQDVNFVIGVLQLPVTAIIVAISMEDAAMKKAGMFLQEEK
jgi:hypothetical protein